MRLHLPGLPHTITRDSFSHCAFTGKVQKFIPMMRAQGYDVLHYGVGDENPGATEHIQLLTQAEQETLLGHKHDDPTAFVGNDANVGHPAYTTFNTRLAAALATRVTTDDLVCLPFGHGHQAGTRDHAGINVETGIGYPVCCEPFRIYESNAWYALHCGMENQPGSDYQWVIPNYFDATQWNLGPPKRQYLLYFGRLLEIKGLAVVKEIAKARPDLTVFMCGQGDPSPWLDPAVPNLQYLPPVTGRARSALLGNAIALLAPSRYIEPFCGVTVEANLCGTPALTSDHGVFPETITNGHNGYRCHTLGDWLEGIRRVEQYDFSRHIAIQEQAIEKYSLEAVGPMYSRVFQQLADLRSNGAHGWYNPRSFLTHG